MAGKAQAFVASFRLLALAAQEAAVRPNVGGHQLWPPRQTVSKGPCGTANCIFFLKQQSTGWLDAMVGPYLVVVQQV